MRFAAGVLVGAMVVLTLGASLGQIGQYQAQEILDGDRVIVLTTNTLTGISELVSVQKKYIPESGAIVNGSQ